MQYVNLTLDGALDVADWSVSGHAMRWVPPELVDQIRAERRSREDEARREYVRIISVSQRPGRDLCSR